MNLLRKYIKLADFINEKVGYIVSWLTTGLVLLVCYDVFTRYLLKTSVVATQELQWHIFSIIFLLGAGYTLKHEKHVRVDILYANLSPKKKAIIDIFGTITFLIPFSLLVIWSSKNFVLNSYNYMESSPDPGGLPYRFLLKACIPFGFVFVLIQAFSLLCNSILILLDKNTQNKEA